MARISPRRRAPGNKGLELPAFCRSRRPSVIVEVCRLNSLKHQLWLVLLFQLSTLLLVVAEVGPQHHLSPLPSSPSGLDRGQQ